MKKKNYVKPSMEVYELKQQPKLLAGSNGQATLNSYNWIILTDEE